jgi:hypothetical protein
MYDAVVIGGGVVGCAILRELCCHEGAFLTLPPMLSSATDTLLQAHS